MCAAAASAAAVLCDWQKCRCRTSLEECKYLHSARVDDVTHTRINGVCVCAPVIRRCVWVGFVGLNAYLCVRRKVELGRGVVV